MLVHQKVKEKINLYQCSMYFFYRDLAYHYGWLFLITANASEGCAVGNGMCWPRVRAQQLLSGPLRDRPSAKCIYFFLSCLL